MKPLIVLISVFVLSLIIIRLYQGSFNFSLSAQVAMSCMLVFTAIGHFVFTKGMSMMLPAFIPYKIEIIYLTGLIEITAAIGLFVPAWRGITGWLLIAFFILVLPSNIYAAIKHVDYQKAAFDGNGLVYLWFRVPLQVLFIVWTYFAAIK